MKKAIVTGANGFVGLAVCKALIKNHIQVIGVVKNGTEDIGRLAELGVRIVYCDMQDFRNLYNLIPDRDGDVFYHFAWAGSAGTLRGDSKVQVDNIRYTLDAVLACKDLNCRRFIFAASIMEYEINALMRSEKTPDVNSLYSTAKLAADYMARTLAGNRDIEYLRCVISNIYGPGEISPRLVNTSLRKMLNREHCSFSSGKQMYDFIYISDAANMFVEIGKSGAANRTYYIGSQKPGPLKDFLCAMRDEIDPKMEIGLGELPFEGVSLSYYQEFDIDGVREDTGYIPKVPFSEGIRRTIQWIKSS